MVNRQDPGLILPDSDLVLPLIYLRESGIPWAFWFSTRKFKTFIFLLRYLQGIINSCCQGTWGHVLEGNELIRG